MARMSIDDMVVRDPRITKLSTLVGWSRRETVGCLVLDVWPICYDQREYVIASDLINIAAGHDGFADAMVRAGLAESMRGNLKVRIKGAQERIEYLDRKREAGRVGGVKSGESRRQNSSTGSSGAQALGNPPSPVPPSAPVPVLAPEDTEGPAVADPGLDDLKAKTDRNVAAKAAKVPERAWKAADYLRDLVLEDDSSALVGKQPWGEDDRSGWRLGWANDIRLMVERDGRTYEQIAETLRFVFREQSGNARFVVQSADALRDKWDRIQAVRRNKSAAPQTEFRNIEEL